jgi:hypothetical protein
MFGMRLGHDEVRSSKGHGKRSWRPRAVSTVPRRHRGRRRSFLPGASAFAFENLESRTLLNAATDLTQQIDQYLTQGMTSGSITLPNPVTLGSFLTATNVTLGFNVTQGGPNWTGSVTVSAGSATLALGQAFSAQVPASAQQTPTLTGSYTLNNEPLNQGAYAITATELDVTASKLVTGTATNVQLDYSPSAAPGQKLAHVGALTASLTPFAGASATLSNLDIYDNGFALENGVVTVGSFTLGSAVSVTSPTLTFSGVGDTVGSPPTGTITLGAGTAQLFPGKTAFTATVANFSGSYDVNAQALSLQASDVNLAVGKILKADATGLSFAYSPSAAPALTIDAASVSLTSPLFPGVTGTATSLHADSGGFSVASATLHADSATIGSVLQLTNLNVGVTGLSYSTSPPAGALPLAGTIGITADSAALFPGKSFNASLKGFSGSYNINTSALSLAATEFDLSFGKMLQATSTGVSLTYDGTQVAVAATSITLTSSLFPGATGSINNLSADSTGFSIASASLTAPKVSISELEVDNINISVTGLSYTTSTQTLAGSIGISAGTVSLFPGKTAFTATVKGFAGSYDINAQALSLSATEADFQASSVLMVTASNLGFSLQPTAGGENVSITVGAATATFPKFGVSGSITALAITQDGFSLGSATLAINTGKPIMIGKTFSVVNPSITVTNFGYSISQGASFTGTVAVAADEIDLTIGSLATGKATGIAGSISFATADLGHFTFSASTVNLALGSFLTLSATKIAFDSAPAAQGDIASFGSISATLTLPAGVSISGSGQDFAIGADGSFITGPNFGVSLTVSDAGTLKWPTWLPIQISHVGIKWPSFSTDPTNFTLDLSASVNVSSLSGTGLEFDGFVQDAVIDVGLLEQGQFPITGVGGFGIGVGGTVFGVEVKGQLFLAFLDTDSSGNVIPDGNPNNVQVAHHYFYGGIDAAFNLMGYAGFEIRLGISQFGPLDGYVDDSNVQILDPFSGLALTNFHAGIDFGRTLPNISNPQDLATNPGFNPPGNMTLLQWKDELASQVANVALLANGNRPLSDLATEVTIDGGATLFDAYSSEDSFRLDGDVLFSTDGKLEVQGALTVGSEISLKGAGFIDLSQVAAGKAQLLMYIQGPAQAPIVTVFGGIAFDFSGQPPTTNVGPTTPSLGTGLTLGGSTDDVTASNINLNSTSYTIEFWAQRADSGRTEYVIGQGDANTAGDLQIGYDSQNRFFVTQSGQTLNYATTDNKWHHWAVTFDQSTGNRAIYKDGLPVASDTGAQPLSGTSMTFLIGRSGSTYFNGSVDEVRVWNLPRSAADIEANYGQGFLTLPAVGLVADWTFDEGQGTTASDSSGNNNTATLEGNPQWTTTVVNPPAPPAFGSFSITITGGVDLTLKGLPGGLSVVGSAVFLISPSQNALDLTVNGTVNLDPVGNLLQLGGHLHYDDATGTPEIYGGFALQTGQLSQLQQLGINVAGTAVLLFNSTSQTIPNQTIALPDKSTRTYSLPAQSVSLQINGSADFQRGGQDWFSLTGQLDAFFTFTTDAAGVHPELQIDFIGMMLAGPATSPYVSLSGSGYLQLSDAGIAADLSFSLLPNQTLANAGILLKNDTFTVFLNTTGQEIKYTIPAVSDPSQGVVSGANTAIDIPAAPTGTTTPAPYLQINGQGELDIESSFDLTGSFSILAAPGVLTFGLNMNLGLTAQGTTLVTFLVQGGLTFNSQGVVGGISVQPAAPFPAGYGVNLNGSFLLEVNTTGKQQAVGGLTIPAGNYALVHTVGDLTFGPVDAHGTFDLQASGGGVMITVAAGAALGPLRTASLTGNLTLQSGAHPGAYGILQAALVSSPSIPGIGFSANLQFELNTANIGETVSGFSVDPTSGNIAGNQSITIGQGTIMLDAGGQLTIASLLNLSGKFDFTVNSSGLDLNANATLTSFLGANLGLQAHLALLNADAQGSGGLVGSASLSLNANLGIGVFSVIATPTLIVNTTNVARSGIAANTYEVALYNASLNFVGFQAGGTVIVGVNGGVFDIEIPSSNPITLSFFGLGSASLYGYIRSNGQYSLTGALGFDLGQSGNELWGVIVMTISSSGFSASVSGGASVFGVNLASVYGSLDIEGGYVHLGATVYVIGIPFSFDFTLGQLATPNVPASIYWYSVPAAANEGDNVTFDAGATDTQGKPVADSGYQWTVYRAGQVYSTSIGAMDTLQLGDPGTYTVLLNVAGLSRSATIQVANVAPLIQSVAAASAYVYMSQLTLAPSIIDPGSSDQNGGLVYNWTLTKNGGSTPFLTRSTTSKQLTFAPDLPPAPVISAAGAAPSAAPPPDVYHVVLTVTDTSGASATLARDIVVFNPANIVVNTAQDNTQVTTDSSGHVLTPLRVAIQAASNNGGSVAYVHFDPSLAGQTILLNPALANTSTPAGASAIAISQGLVYLDGSAAPGITLAVPSGANMRLFYVAHSAALDLYDMNLTGGNLTGSSVQGGAVFVDGLLNVFNSTLHHNAVYGTGTYGIGLGGAVFVDGNGGLYALDSTFAYNNAGANYLGGGGAIYSTSGMSLIDNTIAYNSVGAYVNAPTGAGVYDDVYNPVANNLPIYRVAYGNIVAGNTGAPDYQVYNTLEAFGDFNLIGTISGTPTDPTGNPFVATSANPLLGRFSDHGNGVYTFGLLPGSPAIGLEPVGLAVATPFDGRGYARSYNNKQDVGAFQTQPYVVTNTNDSGPGSLRLALMADDNGAPITLAPGLAGQKITLTSGPIEIASQYPLVVGSTGTSPVTISANSASRIFTIDPGANVTFSGLTFADGLASQGGAFSNSGTLTITGSSFTNDIATSGPGGAIYNAAGATLNVGSTTFAYDSAYFAGTGTGRGGAVYNASGATFNGYDDTFANNAVQGTNVYGSDGYNVVYDQAINPSYAAVNYTGSAGYIWASSTTDPRALQRATNPSARLAATLYAATSFTIDVNLTDGKPHMVTLYALDWDSTARSERIDVLDATTGKVLDTRTISAFHNGLYLSWAVQGHVQFKVTALTSNAVIAGLFFDPAPAGTSGPATFLGTDIATEGNWKGASGPSYGGAIDNAGTATLASTTVAFNTVASGTAATASTPSDGAGITNEASGRLTLTNTIVANDSGGSHDLLNLAGGTVTGDHNIVTSSAGLSSSVALLTASPQLRPLANFGGPVPTLALQPGSPAIDAGNTAAAATPSWAAFNPASISNLGAWYKGEGSGADSVGGPAATLSNITFAPGKFGQGFQFNGVNSAVSIPSNPTNGSLNFSVGGWFNLSQAPSSGSVYYLASKYNGTYYGWTLQVNSALVPSAYFSEAIGVTATATSTSPITLNTWNYVALTFDGNTFRLYINGVQTASASLSYIYTPASNPLTIGSSSWSGGGGSMAGLADEFTVFTRPLTQIEIQEIYNGGQTSDGRGFARVAGAAVDIGAFEFQPYVVTTAADSGPGSLRQAVADDSRGDAPITFAPALSGQTISLTSGPIAIGHDLTINGPGASLLTISGGNTVEDFAVAAGNVTITGLTIAGGLAPKGGGIFNAGNLTVADSAFANDTARGSTSTSSGQGGAIFSAPGATLTVTGSTFTSDSATGQFTPGASLAGRGGAIASAPGATLSATNDTFTADSAQAQKVYGTEGYNVYNDLWSYPPYLSGNNYIGYTSFVWSTSTSDPRALQKADPGATDRFAGTIYAATSFTIDETFGDGKAHTVSVYALDWEGTTRSERIDVVDPATGNVLDSRTVSSFHNGVYLSWVLSGHFQLRVTALSGNAVLSGIFFDPAPAGVTGPATFLGMDTTTQGNWKGAAGGIGIGGAIDNAGAATLVNVTVARNSVVTGPGNPANVSSDGAGIANEAGATLKLVNTIAANDTGGNDVLNQGTLTGSHDLIMTSSGLPTGIATLSADPKLGPLASNGGPTPTLALLAGSPAIDAGDPAAAGDPSVDQRGLSRTAGTALDIGAYEYAAPVLVTNTNDSGPGSLRQALTTVASFPGSPIGFSPALAGQTIALGSELQILAAVTIDGSAAPGLIIKGNGLKATNGTSRDVYVAPGVTATLRNLPIQGGYADVGGGIYNGGTLTIQGSTISGNTAYASGGGIANDGTLAVIDSTVTGNTLINVSGLTGAYLGQGAGIRNAGTLTLEGDTISGNSGLINLGSSTTGFGGGIANSAGVTFLHDTILSGNTAATGDGQDAYTAAGTILSFGHNLVGNTVGTFTLAGGDLTGVNPMLGSLQSSGGPTQTLALLAGSPAIDAGDSGSVTPPIAPVSGLVAWYRGEGNAQDSAGSSSGTLQGGATTVPGRFGQAFQLNGTTQYVDLGNPAVLNFSGQITLEAWIKPQSTSGLQDIVAHGYQVSPNNAEDFLRINNGNYEVGSWNGNNAFAQAPIPAGDIGQWIHLAGVYDGTRWILYRNGVQLATSGSTTQGALPVSSTDWAIGARGTGTERFFKGVIDEVAIYNRGLSPSEILQAVTSTTAPANDQRGFARPVGNGIDIGAYERQPFVVTATADSGPGSLRQAASSDNDGSLITFAPALAGQTITLASPIVLQSSETIDASAAPGLVVSGGGTNRIFTVNAGATITLNDLTFTRGAAAQGGAIQNSGNLTVTGSTFTGNAAVGTTGSGRGGAIDNAAGATFSGTDDTFSGNSAQGGSTTAGFGGAIDNAGTATLVSTTVTSNLVGSGASAPAGTTSDGAGIVNEAGATLTLIDTIVAGDTGGNDIVNLGTVTGGHDLAVTSVGIAAGVITVTANPQLGALQNNGGATQTLALLPGSPAIDAGDPAATGTAAPATDQRGLPRVVNGVIDIGALEVQAGSPQADPGDPYMIHEGDSLTLNAGDSTAAQGLALTYSWDVNGDGVYGDASGVSPTLTWPQLQALGIQASPTPYMVTVQINDGYGGTHIITSQPVTLTVLPALHVTALTIDAGGAQAQPVNSATVTFSAPINPSTINASDLSLSLDGGPDLITGPISVQAVSGSASSDQITGLSALNQANGTYTLSLDASGVSDAVGAGVGVATISWLVDTTAPDSNVAPLPAQETSLTFPVTAVGDDPGPSPSGQGSGLVACDLYVSTDGGPYVYFTTVHPWTPTALFQGQQETSYSFYSIGHDALGNSEPVPTTAQAQTFVPDLTPPVTHVTSVNASTPTFVVSYAGNDAGGSGLASTAIYVQVDGGSAQEVAQPTAPSGTVNYAAVVDGATHSYRFYSQGVDGAGNLQAAPTDPTADVVVSASFVPPDTTPPVTHVTSVDSSKPDFQVSYTGTDAGGSGLSRTTVFVQVDGGAAQQVAQVTASSGTISYQAPVDGNAHTYRFYSEGVDGAGNTQAAPTDATADVVVTATFSPPDTTPPVTHVTAVDATLSTFQVSYAGTDTGGSGLASTTIFVQVDGAPAQQVAQLTGSSGTVAYSAIDDGAAHTYRFYSLGLDGAGNAQAAPTDPSADQVVTATFAAPSTTSPPVTHVTTVDSSTPLFAVSYAGTDTGGSGLASTTIFVQVDGGPAQQVGLVTASSGTVAYQAIVDGEAHSYRFYSQGVDTANNTQPAPADPSADVVVTAQFSPVALQQPTPTLSPTPSPTPTPSPSPTSTPTPAPLQLTGLVVQHGTAERSFVRYVDIVFNESDGLAALVAGNHVHLIKHNLQSGATTPVALDGLLHVVDHAIEIDFGALGIGGNPTSSAADGTYEIDIDGFAQPYTFDRLLGDVNGDGVVNQADLKLVKASMGKSGTALQADVNGDGVVSKRDLSLVQHTQGHKLALKKPTGHPKGHK